MLTIPPNPIYISFLCFLWTKIKRKKTKRKKKKKSINKIYINYETRRIVVLPFPKKKIRLPPDSIRFFVCFSLTISRNQSTPNPIENSFFLFLSSPTNPPANRHANRRVTTESITVLFSNWFLLIIIILTLFFSTFWNLLLGFLLHSCSIVKKIFFSSLFLKLFGLFVDFLIACVLLHNNEISAFATLPPPPPPPMLLL